jgi:hypothetical protein
MGTRNKPLKLKRTIEPISATDGESDRILSNKITTVPQETEGYEERVAPLESNNIVSSKEPNASHAIEEEATPTLVVG